MSEKNRDTDRQLVESLKKGDLYAFDQLFTKYSKKLYYFANGYLNSKEDAEGLVQEVFLKIWKKRKDLKEHLSFNAFIYTVTFNTIRIYFRAKSREAKHLEKYLEDFRKTDNKTVLDIEYNSLLELADKAIDKLPEKRKRIFLLSRHEGLTNEEIASRLQISKKTVENQMTQALKFLREHLGQETMLSILFYYLFIF
ncbi:MAG: RNA polymerase sigma-70 factor [Bacteroidota bacterium]